MAVFLVRSLGDPRGYSELNAPSGKLPRTKTESYVPWGMPDDKVVYAQTGMHTSWRASGGMQPYGTLVGRRRRRVCKSRFGGVRFAQSRLHGVTTVAGTVPTGETSAGHPEQSRNRGVRRPGYAQPAVRGPAFPAPPAACSRRRSPLAVSTPAKCSSNTPWPSWLLGRRRDA